MGCVLDESDTDGPKCCRKIGRGIQHECARVLHEVLLMSVLLYGGETVYGGRKRGLGLEP